MSELFRHGLREAVRGVQAGHFSSEDYTRSCLARIERHESTVQAWAWFDAARALDQARAADRMPRDDARSLRGMPFGVKDVIDTAGLPTEMGSTVFRGRVPQDSAAVINRLEAAGGYVLGKTVTAEMAFYSPGKTRNPWNPAHTPGGSSSGSAAAVAAGFVPAALGTQTNGSVIRPAAFCGVVGFKPSSGLLSRAGVQLFSQTLDHVGVFARSVQDVALMTNCLACFDARDPSGVGTQRTIQDIPPLKAPPRLAFVRTPVWLSAQPHQRDNLLESASRFASADAIVEEVALPLAFQEAHVLHHTIMFGEGARALRAAQTAHRSQLSDKLNALIDEGMAISDEEIAQALAQRLLLNQALRDVWNRYDAFITPPATGEAPATLDQTGDPAFCTIWTLTGLPAITLPSGLGRNGLPLGTQLIGAYMRDDKLLQVAQWCEEKLGWGARIAEVKQ